MSKLPEIVAVDFDGTIAKHMYPQIGAPVPGAIEFLHELQAAGVRLILWTMRSGERLEEAVTWCAWHGLTFWSVNINPEQHSWTKSPKAYAHRYIDDAAAGCPLKQHEDDERPWVDYEAIRASWGFPPPALLVARTDGES